MRHALKNGLIPVVTLIGLQIGALIEGAVITEQIFFWPGVGRLVVDSIAGRDYPVVQAIVLLSALSFMLSTLLVDIAYALARPAHLVPGRAGDRRRAGHPARRRSRRAGSRSRRGARLAGSAAAAIHALFIGGGLVACLIVVAVFAPLLSRYDPIVGDIADSLEPPRLRRTGSGTDDQGRDVLARVMYGARVSLAVAVISVTIGLVVGVLDRAAGGLRRRDGRSAADAGDRRDPGVSRRCCWRSRSPRRSGRRFRTR